MHGARKISSLVVFDSFCYLHHNEYIVADHCCGICFPQTVYLKKKSYELSLKRMLSGIRHMDNVYEELSHNSNTKNFQHCMCSQGTSC